MNDEIRNQIRADTAKEIMLAFNDKDLTQHDVLAIAVFTLAKVISQIKNLPAKDAMILARCLHDFISNAILL
jgi:Na+/citrate or Na+/malate symporter